MCSVAAPLGGLQLVVEGADQEPGGGAQEEEGRRVGGGAAA